MRTVLLNCPKCGEPLTGWPVDRVFFCTSCRIGVDFWEDPAALIPVNYASLPKEKGDTDSRIIRLPVWFYEVEITIESHDEEAVEAAMCVAPSCVYVFGSIFQKTTLHGDPNIEMTRRQPVFSMDSEPTVLRGCQLRRQHADNLVLPVASAVIDQTRDVTGLTIDAMIKKRYLIAVPFAISDKHIMELHTAYSINKTVFLMDSRSTIDARPISGD